MFSKLTYDLFNEQSFVLLQWEYKNRKHFYYTMEKELEEIVDKQFAKRNQLSPSLSICLYSLQFGLSFVFFRNLHIQDKLNCPWFLDIYTL